VRRAAIASTVLPPRGVCEKVRECGPLFQEGVGFRVWGAAGSKALCEIQIPQESKDALLVKMIGTLAAVLRGSV